MAVGPQIAPFYTADDKLAADLAQAGRAVSDPVWRMPLWKPYAEAVEADIADLRNDPDGWAQAGSITAALFLQRFAPQRGWMHLDIFGWNPRGRPGWPVGAEVMAARAVYDLFEAPLSMTSDRRTLLARPDLADVRLEGEVRAERYAAATPMRCAVASAVATAAIRAAADDGAGQEDQLLLGEAFDVLETEDGWAWGQARRDGYVGFVRADALADAGPAPTHRIAVLRTFGFSSPDLKSPRSAPTT